MAACSMVDAGLAENVFDTQNVEQYVCCLSSLSCRDLLL